MVVAMIDNRTSDECSAPMTPLRPFHLAGAALLAATLVTGGRLAAQDARYDFLLDEAQVRALVTAWNDGLAAVPGEVLVKFRTGVPPAGAERAFDAMRGPARSRDTQWLGDDLALVRTAAEPDPAAAAAAMARQPEVAWAQPNYFRPLLATPDDPAYHRQWNLELLGMPRAWDLNPGATNAVTVAIIDTGFTAATMVPAFSLWTGHGFEVVGVPFGANPDLPAVRVDRGRDFVFWRGPVLDLVGHGTHVAGTALQETNNAIGLAGMAYRATLMPLKACLGYWDIQILISQLGIPGFVNPFVTGGCSDAAIVEALRYAADQGAAVINLSLGSPQPAPAIRDALEYAVSRGAFVAVAAGNAFESGNPVEYPAAYAPAIDGVVSVGAVGPSRARAFYSATGSHVELVAPGGDNRAAGTAGLIYQTGLRGADFNPFTVIRPRFDRYIEAALQGTSMAAPHVAGAAALLVSQDITDPAAVEAALTGFAVDLGPVGRDDEHGHGLIDPRRALRGLGLAR
jgi:serine protease